MKHLIVLIGILFFSSSLFSQWDFIGSSAGNTCTESVIEISFNGTLYNARKLGTGIRVYKWENNSWQAIGSLFGGSAAFDIQLQIIGNDTPVVAYKNFFGSFETLAIQRWTGSSWGAYGYNSNPIVTDHNKDFHLHSNQDWELYLTYFDDYYDNELIALQLTGTTFNKLTGGNVDDGNFGNAVSTYGDADGYLWVGHEQNDIGDYIGLNRHSGSSWSGYSSLNNNSDAEEIVFSNDGSALGMAHLAIDYSGSFDYLRFRAFNVYSPFSYGTELNVASGSAVSEFDMDVEADEFYVFYKSGTSNFIRRVTTPLTPAVTTFASNPAPNGSTDLNIERWNGRTVISYINAGKTYIKELNNDPVFLDNDNFEMCETVAFNGNEFALSFFDNNYTHNNLDVTITSQNTSIIPTSQVTPILMSITEDGYIYYTYNVNNSNEVTSTTIVDLEWEVEENNTSIFTNTVGLTVNDSPAISFLLQNNEFCENENQLNLTGLAQPLNGSWYGDAVANSNFKPNLAAVGPQYLKYQVTSASTGCVGLDSVLVYVNETPTLNVSTIDSECNETNGSASVNIAGGDAPYNVYWSSGDNGISSSDLAPGQYFVYATDDNGCFNQAPALVGAQGINISSSTSNNLCAGFQNGAIDLTVSGDNPPFSFYWSHDGALTEDVAGLVAGPYEVTITDATGCETAASFVINEPQEITYAPQILNSTCNGSTGAINLNVLSGNTPLTFEWENALGNPVGGNNQQLVGVPAGSYSCLITDANGCSESYTGVISNPGATVIALDNIDPATCANDGAIDINVFPSSTVDAINWSNGATTEDISNLSAGYYSVQISNTQNNCISVVGFDVPSYSPPVIPICLVTVDTNTITNKVVWEKPVTTQIDYFNIYRETSQAGLYQIVGTVDYDDVSEFTDPVAFPQVRSWRYKLSSVDLCGLESPLSAEHKTIHLVVNFGIGNVMNLAWDAYEGFPYSSFEIYRVSDITPWEPIGGLLPNNTFSYTDNAVPSFTDLNYFISIDAPNTCTSSLNKAQDFNSTRSNKTKGIAAPGQGNDVGLEEDDYEITIYPNPSNGSVTLLNEGKDMEYTILDMKGSTIKTGTLAGKTTLDLSEFGTGVYTLRTEKYTHKLVIK